MITTRKAHTRISKKGKNEHVREHKISIVNKINRGGDLFDHLYNVGDTDLYNSPIADLIKGEKHLQYVLNVRMRECANKVAVRYHLTAIVEKIYDILISHSRFASIANSKNKSVEDLNKYINFQLGMTKKEVKENGNFDEFLLCAGKAIEASGNFRIKGGKECNDGHYGKFALRVFYAKKEGETYEEAWNRQLKEDDKYAKSKNQENPETYKGGGRDLNHIAQSGYKYSVNAHEDTISGEKIMSTLLMIRKKEETNKTSLENALENFCLQIPEKIKNVGEDIDDDTLYAMYGDIQ